MPKVCSECMLYDEEAYMPAIIQTIVCVVVYTIFIKFYFIVRLFVIFFPFYLLRNKSLQSIKILFTLASCISCLFHLMIKQ